MEAIADAMREEYTAIVEAGFLLQIDDPLLTSLYHEDPFGLGPERHIDLLNHALRGIPPDKVRYHTCYGINEGPRIHDVPLLDLVPLLLRINAQAYSFEAANPRHLHEWHVWEQVKLPGRQAADPGHDLPRVQHRRAPRADRRLPGHVCQPGRPRAGHRRRRLRLLVVGDVCAGSRRQSGLGQIRGAYRKVPG